ncbi:helix-turn-helix domain-containing protein [Phenylobacterium sp. LH3H17]|uniref:helix-turn-helix transcriptional regulator n=1 Tax=Phenylobacterium sp. LH3H17 TaxID=2903901 RepID=UPI0020C9F66A|nr:helix-turn-helix domain-containing protein [Phenylobacterium sp. LH3H17]UTP41182.1 helix-turn-helix domain-containing protein [Phenylobacterium sp. LH3H17]
MDHQRAPLPQRFLRTPEAGRLLGLSGRTLEKHRTYGTGPVYRKIGGRVVYAISDLQAWAERGRRASTSELTGDCVSAAKPRGVGRSLRSV